MVCHTILKMERMASALSRRICRRSVWKQEYGPRSGENRAIDSGNEAVLPGGQLWNGSRTFTAQRRQVVEQMIKWRAELEGSRLAQRMTGKDLRPRPRKHTVTQLRCWEKGGDSAGNYPWMLQPHNPGKTSQNRDSERYVCQPPSLSSRLLVLLYPASNLIQVNPYLPLQFQKSSNQV